ncbi:unnamed protein product [Ranitomeya imitator]|uniref:non-specific serine/threonine protein kinase n=1 Tax=Ranitomeya imitator TaxID=111125 RepID=A0ABN9LLH6_9NEOB|nr:unnamed protein product [Ranitomeya imitator]
MSFGNQGARVWRKTGEKEMPKCLKSSVKYPQSVMVWGAMSAAGVGPLCFIKGRVNAASYQEILEHFMLPSAEMLYGDEDFIFQHDLAPAHSAKTTGKWFTDHGITVLNWPANSPDLNPIENLWDIVKRKLRDARPNTLDELKAAIEASWASITSQQCHRLIASMPRRIEAVISAKGFPTKLLKVKPEERLTIEGVLDHPWLNSTEALDNILPSAQMMMDKVAMVAGIQQAHAEQLANMRIQDLNVNLKPLNIVNNPILRKRKLLGTKPKDNVYGQDPENLAEDSNVALEKLRDVIAQCILPQAGENEDEKLNEVVLEAWEYNRDCKLLRDTLQSFSWNGEILINVHY